jgi:hypothetical protein
MVLRTSPSIGRKVEQNYEILARCWGSYAAGEFAANMYAILFLLACLWLVGVIAGYRG